MDGLKDAIIWRKDIYENQMKCNVCGAKLWDVSAKTATENLGVAERQQDRCYCIKCKNLVAVIRPYNGPGEGMMGYWPFEIKELNDENA